jgi:hypothetical protein
VFDWAALQESLDRGHAAGQTSMCILVCSQGDHVLNASLAANIPAGVNVTVAPAQGLEGCASGVQLNALGDRFFIAASGGSSLQIKNLTLRYGQGDRGGAVQMAANGILKLEGCSFVRTSATSQYGGGGAIHMGEKSMLVVKDCNFIESSDVGRGGAIYKEKNGILSVQGCLFSETRAGDGGAIFLSDNCLARVGDSVFARTSADGGSDGGALFMKRNGVLTANRCLFIRSSAVNGGAVYMDKNGVFNASGETHVCGKNLL